MVKQLAKIYGFEAFFYWQPTLLSKVNRTLFEKTLFDKAHPYHDSFAAVYKVIKESSHEDVIDISDVFTNNKKTLFYDWVHVLEEGNDIIAQRMSIDIVNAYQTKK